MNYLLLGLNYTLMILMPIILAVWIHRRTGAPVRFFFMGAVTFIASQVLHIPFNILVERSGILPTDLASWANLLIVAIFLGLSAGVFEEGARYLTYRYWAKDARSWSRGLMLGAGHGGIEAILLGALGAFGFVSLVLTAGNETLMSAIPADQQAIITQSLNDLLATPWYGMLLGALERAFAITAHLAMSILVLQVFLRRSIVWLFIAIGYHALLDAVAVIGINRVGPYATEALVGAIALLGLVIIFRLRTPEPVEPEPEPLPAPALDEPPELKPTAELLDRSRYD